MAFTVCWRGGWRLALDCFCRKHALCEIAENAKKAIFNVRAIVQSKHAANVRNDD